MKPSLPPVHQALSSASTIYLTVATLVVVFVGLLVFVMLLRKFLRHESRQQAGDWASPKADSENASAFAAASMHGVIEKLRAQEKELARLHLLAQERAQESERLTEEVTRNMPTGLLLVNATGAISSTNPAAEEALGVRSMRYRSYKEILGPDSDLARMLTACLQRRADVSSRRSGTPDGRRRSAPARRNDFADLPVEGSRHKRPAPGARPQQAVPEAKVSGALCLMSDLTELAALQKQIRWKENLAALGEMSAGIAHEFKNALATISGYAQMIHSEANPGDIRETSERILDQTRALTHVVTEFLRFAKPLEICYETVTMQTAGRTRRRGTARSHAGVRGRMPKARSSICRATKRCCARRS